MSLQGHVNIHTCMCACVYVRACVWGRRAGVEGPELEGDL